jgi:hypothetical protein
MLHFKTQSTGEGIAKCIPNNAEEDNLNMQQNVRSLHLISGVTIVNDVCNSPLGVS